MIASLPHNEINLKQSLYVEEHSNHCHVMVTISKTFGVLASLSDGMQSQSQIIHILSPYHQSTHIHAQAHKLSHNNFVPEVGGEEFALPESSSATLHGLE